MLKLYERTHETKSKNNMIITISGKAGTGKTTIAKKLASKLRRKKIELRRTL